MKRGLLSKLGLGQSNNDADSNNSLVQSRALARQNIKNLLNETRATSPQSTTKVAPPSPPDVDFFTQSAPLTTTNPTSEKRTVSSQKILPESAALIEHTWQADSNFHKKTFEEDKPSENDFESVAPDTTGHALPQENALHSSSIPHVKRPQSGIFHDAMQKIEQERGIISEALGSSNNQTLSTVDNVPMLNGKQAQTTALQKNTPTPVEKAHSLQHEDDFLFPLDQDFQPAPSMNPPEIPSSELNVPPHTKESSHQNNTDELKSQTPKPSKKEMFEIKRKAFKTRQETEQEKKQKQALIDAELMQQHQQEKERNALERQQIKADLIQHEAEIQAWREQEKLRLAEEYAIRLENEKREIQEKYDQILAREKEKLSELLGDKQPLTSQYTTPFIQETASHHYIPEIDTSNPYLDTPRASTDHFADLDTSTYTTLSNDFTISSSRIEKEDDYPSVSDEYSTLTIPDINQAHSVISTSTSQTPYVHLNSEILEETYDWSSEETDAVPLASDKVSMSHDVSTQAEQTSLFNHQLDSDVEMLTLNTEIESSLFDKTEMPFDLPFSEHIVTERPTVTSTAEKPVSSVFVTEDYFDDSLYFKHALVPELQDESAEIKETPENKTVPRKLNKASLPSIESIEVATPTEMAQHTEDKALTSAPKVRKKRSTPKDYVAKTPKRKKNIASDEVETKTKTRKATAKRKTTTKKTASNKTVESQISAEPKKRKTAKKTPIDETSEKLKRAPRKKIAADSTPEIAKNDEVKVTRRRKKKIEE